MIQEILGNNICLACGNTYRSGARFCKRCGKSIEGSPAFPSNVSMTTETEKPRYCASCNALIKSNANYCHKCGFEQSKSQALPFIISGLVDRVPGLKLLIEREGLKLDVSLIALYNPTVITRDDGGVIIESHNGQRYSIEPGCFTFVGPSKEVSLSQLQAYDGVKKKAIQALFSDKWNGLMSSAQLVNPETSLGEEQKQAMCRHCGQKTVPWNGGACSHCGKNSSDL